VAAQAGAVTVSAARITGAFHQPRQPKPHMVVSVDDIGRAAEAIVWEVQAIYQRCRRKSQGRSRVFLFIAPTLEAYLIPDASPAAEEWSREHWAWFVGAYVPYEPTPSDAAQSRRPALSAVTAGLNEDLRDHLRDLGYMGV
jgi:hypothetical protein